MKKNIFKKHTEDQMYNELTYTLIININDKLESYSEEKETTL